MSEAYEKEIVQHMIRNLLGIQLLRIVEAKPTWGYHIKKQVEADFNVRLRHGALYTALNDLEARGFIKSRRQQKAGRARKVYKITEDGRNYLQAYYNVLFAQVKGVIRQRTA